MIYNMRNRQKRQPKRQFREYKYNYTYEVVNLINLKSYIGSGSCNCPINEDRYMGSSPTFNEIIKNEGKENFIKVILETYETREDAYDGEDFIHKRFNTGKNPMFYNKHKGRKPSIDRNQVMQLKQEGFNPTEISKKMNINRTSVYRALNALKEMNYDTSADGDITDSSDVEPFKEIYSRVIEYKKDKDISVETKRKITEVMINNCLK